MTATPTVLITGVRLKGRPILKSLLLDLHQFRCYVITQLSLLKYVFLLLHEIGLIFKHNCSWTCFLKYNLHISARFWTKNPPLCFIRTFFHADSLWMFNYYSISTYLLHFLIAVLAISRSNLKCETPFSVIVSACNWHASDRYSGPSTPKLHPLPSLGRIS